MDFARELRVLPGRRIRLSRIDAADTRGLSDPDAADRERDEHVRRTADLASRLWAEDRRSLLIILQGMDTSGKDGTIRHVFSGINPQGCRVTSFKAPTHVELDHDFLWRIHHACPARGEIGVFNRSHYEDVGIVRVHNLVPKPVWSARYDQINRFERHLHENGTTIIKFFLHISKAEQKRRLQARLDDPAKNWKMNPDDLRERRLWNSYIKAYDDAISRCSTRHAPWFVIPSDCKWFRNLAVAAIVERTLADMRPRYPRPAFDMRRLKITD